MVKRCGFALIELLVVISIVVLLMALLLPALRRVRDQARAVVCQSNLRQCGVYFSMYTEQNDNRFFSGLRLGAGYPDWYEPMEAYFEDDLDILLCPSATKYRPLPGVHPSWGGGSKSAWEYEGLVASYGTNHWIAPVVEDSRPMVWGPWESWETPLARTAAYAPVFLDCMFGGGSPDSRNGPPLYNDVHTVTGGGCNMAHFCINRHHGYINSLFMDFSVRKVGLKELWTLKWQPEFDTTGPLTKAGGAEAEDWPQWMRRFKDY